jgi:hypothetical protein
MPVAKNELRGDVTMVHNTGDGPVTAVGSKKIPVVRGTMGGRLTLADFPGTDCVAILETPVGAFHPGNDGGCAPKLATSTPRSLPTPPGKLSDYLWQRARPTRGRN